LGYNEEMSADEDIEYTVRNEHLFGSAVREFRQLSGVRQADLAERIDVHRSYLSALENGKSNPAMRTLLRALRALDLEVVIRRKKR
jgi:HTH-type transcriptional regulator/antitoxin HipB